MTNKERILDISYRHRLSHIGSCLTALPIIELIYDSKAPQDRFVLSAGHSHLAHLVVRESRGECDAEKELGKAGIHCDREAGCDVSTGSLGQGLPIALGMALADRSKNVYCLLSDGEMAEGSVWEALEAARRLKTDNLKIHLNLNGFGAYDPIDSEHLIRRLEPYNVTIHRTSVEQYPFLVGLAAHYLIMSEEQYEQTREH